MLDKAQIRKNDSKVGKRVTNMFQAGACALIMSGPYREIWFNIDSQWVHKIINWISHVSNLMTMVLTWLIGISNILILTCRDKLTGPIDKHFFLLILSLQYPTLFKIIKILDLPFGTRSLIVIYSDSWSSVSQYIILVSQVNSDLKHCSNWSSIWISISVFQKYTLI